MENILLIGSGPMAIAYAEVLKAQRKQFIVVGRSDVSAKKFYDATGVMPYVGGVGSFLKDNVVKDSNAIIATGTEALMAVLLGLLNAGVAKVLIEKPAALSIEELLANEKKILPFANKIFVAYNRRFYASVIEAQKIIKEDGGLLSMHFEFTEWAHKIEPLLKAPHVKENWFFANSTHVVDLAFFIAGEPKEWQAYSKEGNLMWHQKTNFSGAGITNQGILFSYLSNWESAGRWAIELLTNKRRIYLKPLEELSIQHKGTTAIVKHDFDDNLDKQFKPGLYKQTAAFLNNDLKKLLNIGIQIEFSRSIYSRMLNSQPVK